MKNLRQHGTAVDTIAETLNTEGIKPRAGKQWYTNSVYRSSRRWSYVKDRGNDARMGDHHRCGSFFTRQTSSTQKTLVAAGITAGIAALLLAVGYAGMLGYQRLRGRWEAHQLTEQAKQFAAQNECFGLSNGKLHPINEAGVPCSETEKIHQRGTSLPPLLPSCDSLSDEEKGTPTSGKDSLGFAFRIQLSAKARAISDSSRDRVTAG